MEVKEEKKIPPLTEVQTKFKFLCFRVNYLPAINTYYINNWEFLPSFPVSVLCMIIGSFTLFNYEAMYYLPFLTTPYKISVYVIYFLFLISYIEIICVGPGYLPWYWKENPEKNDLTGIVVNDEQKDYMLSCGFPRSTYYMKEVRRIVLRPDHFCDWAASFIGKKNHKLFMLFNLFGVIYICQFGYYNFRSFIYVMATKPSVVIVLQLIYFMISIIFSMFTFTFVATGFIELSTPPNTYSKKKNAQTKSCCGLWAEVCGSPKYFLLWILPIPAFLCKKDIDLVEFETPDSDDNDEAPFLPTA